MRCVLEEAQEEPDVKLMIERSMEEEDEHKEEDGGGADEVEKNGGGCDTLGEDSDDHMGGWDENGDPCLPFIGSWHRPVEVAYLKEKMVTVTFRSLNSLVVQVV
nr:unnamed protein product [Digitaria exilis]